MHYSLGLLSLCHLPFEFNTFFFPPHLRSFTHWNMTASPLMGSCVHSCISGLAQRTAAEFLCGATVVRRCGESFQTENFVCPAGQCESGRLYLPRNHQCTVHVCVRCQGRSVKLWIDKSRFSVWKSHCSMAVRGWYTFGKQLTIKVYKTLIIQNILSYFC